MNSRYHETYTVQMKLGGQPIPVLTKPGLAGWNEVSPAVSLLAEHGLTPAGQRGLLYGGGPGGVAVSLARKAPASKLAITGNNFLALALTEQTLALNQVSNTKVLVSAALPEQEYGSFEAAFIDLPKGRRLARRWLVEAFLALQPGGKLYLAGANQGGIQPAIKDANELYGPATVLDYKKGSRIARFTRPAGSPERVGWTAEPGILPGTWQKIHIRAANMDFELVSLPGVFSAEALDDGTALLLDHLPVSASDRVLDIGCGYGLIGLFAARQGAAQVDMVDVDLLAVAAAQENIRRLGLEQARAFAADIAPEGLAEYSLVVTNPPFHAGLEVDYQIAQAIFAAAWRLLKPGGRFVWVANRFLRYEQTIYEQFGNVQTRAETGKFRVLEASKLG